MSALKKKKTEKIPTKKVTKKIPAKHPFRKTVIIFLLFILALSYYYFYEKKQPAQTEETTPTVTYQLLSLNAQDVKSVEIKTSQSLLQVGLAENNDWQIKSDKNRKADKDKVESFIKEIFNLTGYEKIEKENIALQDYGLADSKQTITLKTADKTTIITIGNKTPTGSYYYVSIDNQKIIYATDSSLGTLLEKKSTELEWVPPTPTSVPSPQSELSPTNPA